MIFTFIVVALLSVVLIAFLINVANRNTQAKIQDASIKIETLNAFTKTLNEQLIPQALRSSSNRAILAWLSYLDAVNNGTKTLTTGEFITNAPNLDENLKNAMIFQNYDKTGTGTPTQLLYMYDKGPNPTDTNDDTNYTLTSIFKEIEILANNSGAVFNYTPLNDYTYTITQTSPWGIKVSMNVVDYWVYDAKQTTFWHFTNKPFSIVLNVTNYNDPFRLVLDNRSVTINATGFTNFAPLSNFQAFYQRPEFRAHNDAPSFLNRLQGSVNPNIYGIESILDPTYFPNPSILSNVDFQYWQGIVQGCETDASGVYLDNNPPGNHLTYYIRTCIPQ